jgi:copper chaperone CopZ
MEPLRLRMTSTRSIELVIEGMSCGGCVTRLTAMLKQVPGVDVENVAVGSAHVHAGDAVTNEMLARAVAKAGFKMLETHTRNA